MKAAQGGEALSHFERRNLAREGGIPQGILDPILKEAEVACDELVIVIAESAL
jgi:hypothetical protein